MALKIHNLSGLQCVVWNSILPRLGEESKSPTFTAIDSDMDIELSSHYDKGISMLTWKVCLQVPVTFHKSIYALMCILNKRGENLSVVGREIRIRSGYRLITPRGEYTQKQYELRSFTNADLDFEDYVVYVVIKFIDPSSFQEVAFASTSKNIISERSETTPSPHTLSEDIEKIFGNAEYSDAVLKCNGQSFPVHRNILSARSDVFAAMFRNRMSEGLTGTVNIKNIKPAILQQFLRYIYSEKLGELNAKSAVELYAVANQYNVSYLKQECHSFIVSNMKKENICEILFLADKFENSELLEQAMSFAVEQSEFLKSKEWAEFLESHPSLAVKLFLKFIRKE